jgi:uncharacterized damage-inducible protein DinB
MNTHEHVLQDLDLSTQQIIHLLDHTPEDKFNFRQDQAWSVSDCLEHLIVVERFIHSVLNGETTSLQDRQADMYVPKIKDRFTNREQKIAAPPQLVPQPEARVKESQKQAFLEIRKQLASCLHHQNLADLCLGFKHKVFGELTRYELTYFVIYHSDRHAIQMTEAANC